MRTATRPAARSFRPLECLIEPKVQPARDRNDRHDTRETAAEKRYDALCMERLTLTKICIGVAGFAGLAGVIFTGRWDTALPFAAIALAFALYGMPSGRLGG